MGGAKSNLTLTTPSVSLKIALFMELGRDYPFAFSFLSFARGVWRGGGRGVNNSMDGSGWVWIDKIQNL
jgi:hypothetical protein